MRGAVVQIGTRKYVEYEEDDEFDGHREMKTQGREKNMAQALLSIQIIPKVNPGEEVIPYVDEAISIIKASGVPYRVGPMETTMEGDLDQLLDIVKQMSAAMIERGSPSVLSQIKLSVDAKANASMARLLQKYPDGQ
jgi:Uncharacterized conserved protein